MYERIYTDKKRLSGFKIRFLKRPQMVRKMSSNDLPALFKGIWSRAKQLSSLELLTPTLVEQWAIEKKIENPVTHKTKAGAFFEIPCIQLTVNGETGCFPKISATDDPQWLLRRQANEARAQLWDKMEWFLPLWVSNGSLWKIEADVKNCNRERAIELFDYHTSTIYNLAFQAVCITQILPSAPSLKEIVPLAREAYLAFYSGYRAASIAALIPAIEGSLTKIVPEALKEATIHEKVDGVIDRVVGYMARIHFNRHWAPAEFCAVEYLFAADERVFVLETFRRWLKNYFFCKTDNYNGATWLNRHMFAHATTSSWQDASNFSRLVVALATLAAVESWCSESSSVSVFFPEMNNDSKLLWQQAQFQAEMQMKSKLIEQAQYQKQGRLVPEMPTDDGVLLRKAVLTEDCMEELVRPLRNAGWSVHVEEADPKALYQRVTATSGEKTFKAALLFSCGTANDVYQMLAKDCNAILYRGAPYHQESYARGINVHVGPVLGWQPPISTDTKAS